MRSGKLLHDTLSDLHGRMHDGIRRKVDSEFPERVHETRRGTRRMMRIGKDKSPFATQRNQLVGDLHKRAASEKHARRQCRILKGLHAVFPEAHVPTFLSRANSSIIA